MESQVTVGLAFAAGMASILSPCILPILPSFLAYISGVSVQQIVPPSAAASRVGTGGAGAPPTGAGGAGTPRALVVAHAAAFIAGFTVIFIALGWTAGLVGRLFWGYQTALQRVGGLVITALGLHLAGWVPIPGLDREVRVHVSRKPAGLAGSFLVGLAFAGGWTPCVGPILASILVLAGTTPRSAMLLMAAYALGLAVPFLALALGFHRLTALRRHAAALQRASGLVLAGMGLLLASGGLSRLTAWLLQWFNPIGL